MTGSALVKKNKRKVSKGRPWLVFTEVRVVNSTYWLCMIQRVLMKPFLDHLNCNRDKLGWVTKQQWAMSLKGQTDTYWFSHIIYLILLSEQADGHSRPSRPICPSSALWRLLPLYHTRCRRTLNTYSHLARNSLEIFLSPPWWCHSGRPRACCVLIQLYNLRLWRKQGVCVCVCLHFKKSDTTRKQQSINWC